MTNSKGKPIVDATKMKYQCYSQGEWIFCNENDFRIKRKHGELCRFKFNGDEIWSYPLTVEREFDIKVALNELNFSDNQIESIINVLKKQ